MIEAVGWQQIGRFFARCSDLLTPHGAMLLQAITVDDRAYEVEKASKSFIREYIFPGGCLPSLEVITRNVARHTDLQAVGLEDITASYVETLRRWRHNFTAHTDELAALGYDERFRRIWTLYLAYCEGGSPNGGSATSSCCWPSRGGRSRPGPRCGAPRSQQRANPRYRHRGRRP